MSSPRKHERHSDLACAVRDRLLNREAIVCLNTARDFLPRPWRRALEKHAPHHEGDWSARVKRSASKTLLQPPQSNFPLQRVQTDFANQFR